MKSTKCLGLSMKCLVVAVALMCCGVQAADEELFNLNDIIVSGEMYLWNRISDVLDIMRGGIGGGLGIGAEVAITEYAQLGAYVTKERGVDFPHFLFPLWMINYYERDENLFNIHEGYYATASFGPWRKEKEEAIDSEYFPRHKWDIRVQLAVLLHLYVNFSYEETCDFFAGFVGWDPAEDDLSIEPDARRRPADQFGRGLSNILFGVVEIPRNVFRITEEEGDAPGFTKGLGVGVWRFLCRELVGVVEFVTFPFGWNAIIEPEYVFQKVQDTTWRVSRPSFHRRY